MWVVDRKVIYARHGDIELPVIFLKLARTICGISTQLILEQHSFSDHSYQ